MKILLLVKKFDFGGAECHVCDLANCLSKKGHNVIIASNKGRQTQKLHPNVKFIRIKFRDFLLPFNILHLAILTIRHKIDVIHAHQRLPILNAALTGVITGRKSIATVHGQSKYDLKHYLSRKLVSKIIFVSKKTCASASLRYKLENKAVYIPNGAFFNDNNHDAAKNHSYRISYISKISSAHLKFLKLIIKDILPDLQKSYPDLNFCIVGDGKKKQKLEKFIETVNGNKNNNIVSSIGYTSSITQACQTSALIIGAGRVAMEAAALGTPVLSVNIKRLSGLIDIEKYLKIKNTNFIDVEAAPPTKELLKQSIIKFFNKRNHYQKESLFLAKKVKDEFAIEKITNKTVWVYKN